MARSPLYPGEIRQTRRRPWPQRPRPQPLRIRHGDDELTFISTVTTFGTAVDITVSELSIESFFPADAATAQVLRAAGAAAGG